MRIQGVGAVRSEAVRGRPREPASQSRALTTIRPVAPRDPVRFAALLRPDSAVVVQLFAARDGLPQAREKRRAEPALACAAYGAARPARAPVPGQVVDLVA